MFFSLFNRARATAVDSLLDHHASPILGTIIHPAKRSPGDQINRVGMKVHCPVGHQAINPTRVHAAGRGVTIGRMCSLAGKITFGRTGPFGRFAIARKKRVRTT